VLKTFNVKSERATDVSDLDIICSLEEAYRDSFYLFNIDKLRKNYAGMLSAFNSQYENVIIGYSYKTNYVPALLKEMSVLGAYSEVVSRLEYDLALKIGVQPEKIIFNGPLKNYDDIKLALDGESIVNLDSFYEIEFIKNYMKESNKPIKIGLRVNFDMEMNGINHVQNGFSTSRFGFCSTNGSFEKAINELQDMEKVTVVGLHGHFSTNTRSLDVYKKITTTLCDIGKKYLSSTLEYIDIGGGMYGNVPDSMKTEYVPTMDDYADVICAILNREKIHFENNILLIIEPGLSLVVDAFKFYCRVVDVKTNQDEHFVLVNGTIQNIKPTMHTMNLPMKHLRIGDRQYTNGRFNVVGHTCMERDYLSIGLVDKIPHPGDFLVYSNVGAYTIVFNPPFIKERPPIIAQEGNKLWIVRRLEKLNNFINDELYVY
jgi:diaminopimelate decarboxylase